MTVDGAQIKSRQRVRDLAEVYTHVREVDAMLDLVADMFPSKIDPANHDRTFLEPACGSGNFLDGILRRKLSTVTTARYGRGDEFEFRVMRCLSSIYGIDIDQENVDYTRRRLRDIVEWHMHSQLNTRDASVGFFRSVDAVLATNIIRANTLTDAGRIELVEYRPTQSCSFLREWSFLAGKEPSSQLDLFAAPREPKRDLAPIRYSHLGTTPEPMPTQSPIDGVSA